MTLCQFKKDVCKAIRRWCNELPEDGDFTGAELITDHWNEFGDEDYGVIVLVHNNKGVSDGR